MGISLANRMIRASYVSVPLVLGAGDRLAWTELLPAATLDLIPATA